MGECKGQAHSIERWLFGKCVMVEPNVLGQRLRVLAFKGAEARCV